MDRRELHGDQEETLRLLFNSIRSRIWTALPGIVQSFDAAKMTVSVQPAISGVIRKLDGTTTSVRMPVLVDCPVLWTGGGGVTLTYPIAVGDEALVIIASRCIDSWWSQGGLQDPSDLRMHNLSDGFALVGVRSLPRTFAVSTSAAQLRTDDGSAYIELNPTSKNIKAHTSGDVVAEGANVNATATTACTIQAPTITLKGNIVLDGPITQANTAGGSSSSSLIGPVAVTNDVTAGGKSLKTHVHSGVQTGSGNTGQPV